MSIENINNPDTTATVMVRDVEVMKVPPFIGVRDVKKYFGIGRYALWRLLKNPRSGIVGSRPGKMWSISTASILRYLNKHSNKRYRNETI